MKFYLFKFKLSIILIYFANTIYGSEIVFDMNKHCIKRNGRYVACETQSYPLGRTIDIESSFEFLNHLPQEIRVGYRFYCSQVSGFGDFEANVHLDDGNRFSLPLTDVLQQQSMSFI